MHNVTYLANYLHLQALRGGRRAAGGARFDQVVLLGSTRPLDAPDEDAELRPRVVDAGGAPAPGQGRREGVGPPPHISEPLMMDGKLPPFAE